LGITPQRTAQLIASLSQARLIKVTASEIDQRKKDLALTPTGKSRLDALDQQVLELVTTAFKDHPARIKNTQRSIKRLLMAVQGPKPPKAVKK
jgi:DNA-binding MarR family transcriptional regulator